MQRVMAAKLPRITESSELSGHAFRSLKSALNSQCMLASYAIKLPFSENQIKCTSIFTYAVTDLW
jgi:hypothetical protein